VEAARLRPSVGLNKYLKKWEQRFKAMSKSSERSIPLVYQYPGCSTCKRALKWLRDHGIEHQSLDITKSPPSAQELGLLYKGSGLPLKKFFNLSGQSYRAGGFKDRLPQMSEREQLEALAADGKLIKRPLLVTKDAVLVGFDQEAYEEHFS